MVGSINRLFRYNRARSRSSSRRRAVRILGMLSVLPTFPSDRWSDSVAPLYPVVRLVAAWRPTYERCTRAQCTSSVRENADMVRDAWASWLPVWSSHAWISSDLHTGPLSRLGPSDAASVLSIP